jgi:hypothetical protein
MAYNWVKNSLGKCRQNRARKCTWIRAKSVQYVRPLFRSTDAPTLAYAAIDRLGQVEGVPDKKALAALKEQNASSMICIERLRAGGGGQGKHSKRLRNSKQKLQHSYSAQEPNMQSHRASQAALVPFTSRKLTRTFSISTLPSEPCPAAPQIGLLLVAAAVQDDDRGVGITLADIGD